MFVLQYKTEFPHIDAVFNCITKHGVVSRKNLNWIIINKLIACVWILSKHVYDMSVQN